MSQLKGKKIVLGVTGSIAAYKSVFLCRLLIKAGAEVRVVMTPSAIHFVTPLSFSTISKNKVFHRLIDEDEWSNHVELGLWADVILVAPATAQTLAASSTGLCNNMLQAVYLSAKCPVMFAPAMDRDMWLHPSTQKNISVLKSYGNHILTVGEGELASGLIGPGRMLEPEEILEELISFLGEDLEFSGVNVLVNAGPTYEPIDPVRFIGNRSSGKMGVALARSFQRKGANVRLVLGPSVVNTDGLEVDRVESASEMLDACSQHFEKSDVIILSAAVSDFTVDNYVDQKIKKKTGQEFLELRLKKTVDIAKTFGENKREDQILIGFALETDNEEKNARLKLDKKNLDVIVLNSLRNKGAGFGHDTNQVKIISREGRVEESMLKSKAEIADDILQYLLSNYEKQINAIRQK